MGDKAKEITPALGFIDKKIRTGASKQERKAEQAAAEQRKKEDLRLAEATDEVSRAQANALSNRSGRRSLIKTGPGGMAKKLGGV